MTKSTLTRREMLGQTVRLVVIGSAPALLSACEKPEIHCEEVSGLSEADMELRKQLEYRDDSPHGESKNCQNCAFYRAGKKNECGKCTLIKGPIHPLGYCDSWAGKS